ncbi:tyrosine-type recombinase/integrase [Neotabrizicola sp. VNH66]|uniref:tyrosine-type recombinase/integrase n=1 Tax=Neotabrizicola sp. VNH66 TaxID=3400918 RepID=UPI003C0E1CCA
MPLKLARRGDTGIWQCIGTVAGRRIRRSTGTTERALAQEIAAKIESDEHRQRLYGAEAVATMSQAMLAYLEADKPTRFLNRIAGHWKDTRLSAIKPETIRRAARTLYPDASPATWNRQVIVPTQAVINYAAGLGWCHPIRVKRFPVDPKLKTPATVEWVRAFASQAVVDGLPHLAALALFMFATGSRVGQACSLTWNKVDLAACKAVLYTAKPKPWTRIAHLPPELVAAIARIPSNRQGDETVFGYAERSSLKDPWKNVIKRAGIAYLSPHCCRHGFATSMLHRGYDVKTVAARGGWKDATVVLRTYAHAQEDQTVTDALFGTNLTQPENQASVT